MAVQMNEPLADHIAKLGILGLAKGIVSRPDAINGVEARPIAQMNGSAVVPVQPADFHPGPQRVLADALCRHVPAGASGLSNNARLSIASP